MKSRLLLASLALSAAGLVGIVAHEGYTDGAVIPVPGDVPTLGFGSTRRLDGSPVQMGDRTTPPQALARALADVRQFEGALRQCVTVPLHQNEYDAYIGLAYNIGGGAFCASTLVKKLNAGDYAGACDEILRWRRFQGRDCSAAENARICGGLWVRRQGEHRQCMGGAA